MGKLSK